MSARLQESYQAQDLRAEYMSQHYSYTQCYQGDPSIFGKVAVLFGGKSSEREVSLASGNAVLSALRSGGVDCFPIDVGDDIIFQLEQSTPDMAFIVLHGPGGEDGKIQALLELMNIPYTGSDVSGSAIAMNKLVSKHIFAGEHLSTSTHKVLTANSSWAEVFEELGEAFVKPAGEGSSYGISFAGSASELKKAYENAAKYDSTVFAEKYLSGNEYSVPILGGQVLPPLQIISEGKFYDYEAKYLTDSTRYVCPAPVSDQDHKEMADLALGAFKALGCRDWGRIDLMADSKGRYFILEANTVPGMTDHSLVPMAAKQVGLDFESLVLEILAMAQARTRG